MPTWVPLCVSLITSGIQALVTLNISNAFKQAKIDYMEDARKDRHELRNTMQVMSSSLEIRVRNLEIAYAKLSRESK